MSSTDRLFRSIRPLRKPIQLYVRLSLKPLGQQAYHVVERDGAGVAYERMNLISRLFPCLFLNFPTGCCGQCFNQGQIQDFRCGYFDYADSVSLL